MEHARERWPELTNQLLQERGRDERVDHRSYECQGIDREPGEHYGPAAAYMVSRGLDHERVRDASSSLDVADAIRSIDHDIEVLDRSSGTHRRRVAETDLARPRLTRRGPLGREVTMPNAIDTFRAQPAAADAVHERLQEIAALLTHVRTQGRRRGRERRPASGLAAGRSVAQPSLAHCR
jgi:hypothetical protein